MSENQNAPTVKPNKGVKFYNPGDRFSEPILYSLPGAGDIHAVARWIIDADAGSFFNVPTELRLAIDGTRISVDFPTTVLTRFKNRGVLMIDDEWEGSGDEEQDAGLPFARTDDEAKSKGETLWNEYLKAIVRNHIEACGRARAIGGIPLEASGFTKRAFKLLNIADPAAREFEMLAQKGSPGPLPERVQSDEAKQLRTELDETKEMLAKVLRLMEADDSKKKDAAIEAQASKKKASAK